MIYAPGLIKHGGKIETKSDCKILALSAFAVAGGKE